MLGAFRNVRDYGVCLNGGHYGRVHGAVYLLQELVYSDIGGEVVVGDGLLGLQQPRRRDLHQAQT